MKRIFFASGLVVMLMSCANTGNGADAQDTTAMKDTTPASDTRDTVDRGYGAAATGNAASDTSAAGGNKITDSNRTDLQQ